MSDAATQEPRNAQNQRRLTRVTIGTVTSDKRNKTRTVAVAYQYRHPKYGKYLQRLAKYQVHDEQNASKSGDRVQIAPCRPLSRTKAWRLVRVVGADPGPVLQTTVEE